MLEIDTSSWKTVKLNINWGANVAGDVCGLHEMIARHLVSQGNAEPIDWSLDGNGDGKEVQTVPAKPKTKEKRPKRRRS